MLTVSNGFPTVFYMLFLCVVYSDVYIHLDSHTLSVSNMFPSKLHKTVCE